MLPTCLKHNSIAGEKWEKFVTTVLCAHISLDKICLLGFWGNRIFPVVFFLFFIDSIFHSRTFIVETNVPTEGEKVFSWKWGVFRRMKERLFDFNTEYVLLSHPHLRSFEKAEFWRVQNTGSCCEIETMFNAYVCNLKWLRCTRREYNSS